MRDVMKSKVQMAGVAIAIVGVIVLIFSIFGMLSRPAFAAGAASGSYNGYHAYNQTGGNSVSTARSFSGAGGVGFGLSGILDGVLLLVLGFVTYKYGKLEDAAAAT